MASGALCAACQPPELTRGARCERCDGPVAAPVERCGRCLTGFLPSLDRFRAAGPYAGPYRTLLVRGKWAGNRAWIEALEPLVLARLTSELQSLAPFDALVPVPTHSRRWCERGFNAAEVVARLLGRACPETPVVNLLERVRHDPPLSGGATPRARRRAVRGAFRFRPGVSVPRSVGLVDDVLTTGATLAACARALRRAGVERVVGFAALRAPDPFTSGPESLPPLPASSEATTQQADEASLRVDAPLATALRRGGYGHRAVPETFRDDGSR